MVESVDSLKNEGNALFKEGKYTEALDKYSRALGFDVKSAVIYSNRSATYSKLGKFEMALTDASQCIKKSPGWSKGYIRKITALEGLKNYDQVMKAAEEGFRVTAEGNIKREFVKRWFEACKEVNRLPEGSIELPTGIHILSKDYLTVLACLLRSLNGEVPLNQKLTEQCLFSCAEQIEKLLTDFGEPLSSCVKEWMKYLPHEIIPYSINSKAKIEIEQKMVTRTELLIQFFKKDVDPALYPIFRPIFGLTVLVILNRTNILCESNTGHHAAELSNRSLLPLFTSSILNTDDYYSMYIGRLCAVLDSFVGRMYTLDSSEISTVKRYKNTLEEAIQKCPKHLPDFKKNCHLAEQTLHNIHCNILMPTLSPPPVLTHLPMTVENASTFVKQNPKEVRSFLDKRFNDLDCVEFLSLGEVEEIITMTGIYMQLEDQDAALKVFTRGEQAFFQVLGHLLEAHTLKLEQCRTTIVPFRQLVFCQASVLKKPQLFFDVSLRWKCLFDEFRSCLISVGLRKSFADFFESYNKQLSSNSASSACLEELISKQISKEEECLHVNAKPVLKCMSQQNYQTLLNQLPEKSVFLDYISFIPLSETLMEAYCVFAKREEPLTFFPLNYDAIKKQAAVTIHLMNQCRSMYWEQKDTTSFDSRIFFELSVLAKLVLPEPILKVITSKALSQVYVRLDTDIAFVPFDMLLLYVDNSILQHKSLDELCPISVVPLVKPLSLMESISSLGAENASTSDVVKSCYIVSNPDFELKKQASDFDVIDRLANYLSSYLNISSTPGQTLEQLEYSESEADFISFCLQSRGLDVKVLSSGDATLQNVLSITQPFIVHISSHARGYPCRSALRGDFFSDLESAVALAGFNTFFEKNFRQLIPSCGMGQLPSLAISTMNLQGTKLVFLSTCNSSLGNAPMQESVGSLANSFLTAGAETVIATLWSVKDQSAAELSKLFYDRLLNSGVRPSQALSYAKKALFDSLTSNHWSHWGGFMCYGLDKPIIP